MLRLIYRDLNGLASLDEVMRSISDFAEVAVASAVRVHHQRLAPAREGAEREQHRGRVVVDADRRFRADEAPHEIGEVVVAGLSLALDLSLLGENLQGKHIRASLGDIRVDGLQGAAHLHDPEESGGFALDHHAAHEMPPSQADRQLRRNHRRGLACGECGQGVPDRGGGADLGADDRGFGELEAVIMDRLWTRNAVSTVRDIFDDLSQDRRIAYTTVMSTMDNLHRKGILTRERVAQAYHYRPVMTREEYSATLMRASFDPRGDTDLVLTHFLEQMPAEESARVQDALRRIIFDGKQR